MVQFFHLQPPRSVRVNPQAMYMPAKCLCVTYPHPHRRARPPAELNPGRRSAHQKRQLHLVHLRPLPPPVKAQLPTGNLPRQGRLGVLQRRYSV